MHKCPKCGGNMRLQKDLNGKGLYYICDICSNSYTVRNADDNRRRFGKAQCN